MKHNWKKSTLAFLLTLLMLMLLAGMGLPAYAYDGDPYTALIATVDDSYESLAAKAVSFNGYDWNIIADESTAVDAGTLTLIAKEPIDNKPYNERNDGNFYSKSTVKSYLDSLTAEGGAFADVADAIVTIPSITTTFRQKGVSYTDTVTNVKLYLPSKDEVYSWRYKPIISCKEYDGNNTSTWVRWWTRTPGEGGTGSTYYAFNKNRGMITETSGSVTYEYGVRPVLKLDLSKVTFNAENNAFISSTPVSVESVTLNKTDISLTKGATETLTAAVAPADTTFKTVRWSSSDPSIATVDENGKVTAVGPGTATITATATNGTADTADDKSATCTVTVHIDVSYLTLYDYYAIVNVSDSKKLPTVVFHPDNTSDKTLKWESSNTDVATVDQNGRITGISLGNALITVTATNGTEDPADDAPAYIVVKVKATTPGNYTDYVNQTVMFNDMEWYLIDDNSAVDGTVTLFMKQPPDNTYLKQFNAMGKGTAYNGSEMQAFLDSMTAETGAFADVADAIAPTALTDVIPAVENAKLYLLSSAEAEDLPKDIRKCNSINNNNLWVLRTPYLMDITPSSVTKYVQTVWTSSGTLCTGSREVHQDHIVRPALRLDLSKVMFDAATNTFVYGGETVVTEPTITGADLALNGSLDFRFYVDIPAGIDTTGANMTFSIDGRSARRTEVAFDKATEINGKYVFSFPVYSIEMAEPVTATFRYGTDGTVEKVYSVKEYLDTFKSGNAAYNLAIATRNYGHYMQPYLAGLHGFTIGTDYTAMPAGSEITALESLPGFERTWNTSDSLPTGYDNSVLNAVGYYDSFNESTTLSVLVNLKTSPTTVTATVDGETATVDNLSDNIYRIQISNIAANNLGTPYHVVFSADNAVFCDMNVSAMTYVGTVLPKAAERAKTGEAEALTAFYYYYAAAKAYAGN